MTVSASASYRLLYAQVPFSLHTPFLADLRRRFPTVEIPFLDFDHLPEETREVLDNCIYVLADADAGRTVAEVKAAASRGRAFPAALTDMGLVPGRQIRGMLDNFERQQSLDPVTGRFYRVQSGPHRNLIVRLIALEGDVATVEHDVFNEVRRIKLDQGNLHPVRPPADARAVFTNYLRTASARRAVILDADAELHEACCRHDNDYTRAPEGSNQPWGRFVGGAKGFYFAASGLRMFYSVSELHVVFDERPGGPRACTGSERFREAYLGNRDWVKRFSRACGFFVYDRPGERAEDVIAALASRMEHDLGYEEVVIATRGTELYPLVSDRVSLRLPKVNFRDHPQIVKARDAVRKFDLADTSQIPRINWLRAIRGDAAEVPSVNLFNKLTGHGYTNIRQGDYLPHVLAATGLRDLKLRLLTYEGFHPFIEQGQFDRNVAALTLDTAVLDDVPDLRAFRLEDEAGHGLEDGPALKALLEENSFFKEMEYFELFKRVIAGLW